ncbi:phage tail protein [Variovorax sp. PAMC 28711]|uniref:phage tail protein n=1 Tax=Variovorax sp. PAMC 28711 TaxID=1795631 RepID=UPI00078B201F|nr:phage tail protein [Variovorax sp. PAMC 28711]AMM23158.1 hypothetical protein AX767_01305 [Variovorax sp. PAMC 28711]
MVDSTDKIELPFTTSAGKGGGTENTSYRYFVHMRHVLCATPADGSEVAIRKIWQDGKLIYDVSNGVSIGSALATAESPYSFLILYQGHEDQMPDYIEETYHGVGNVPAYRGVVSVRLNIIECQGGRVPQFSFELCRASSILGPRSLLDRTIEGTFTDAGVGRPVIYEVNNASVRVGMWTVNSTTPITQTRVYSGEGDYWATEARSETDRWPVDFGGPYAAGMLGDLYIRTYRGNLADGTLRGYLTEAGPDFVTFDPSAPSSEVLTGLVFSIDQKTMLVFTSASALVDITKWYALGVGGVLIGQGTVSPSLPVGALGYGVSAVNISPEAVGIADNDFQTVWAANLGGLVAEYKMTSGVFSASGRTVSVGALTSSSLSIGMSDAAIYIVSASRMVMVYRLPGIQPNAASIASILDEQCTRAGLTADQYDLDDISGSVWGYTLTNPASARANIQPLMTAFAIDATEEDGKIKFFHRANLVSVATIGYDELGCAEDGGEPGDPMPLTRGQEAELPRSVSVSYINKDFDYQTGTEKAMRQVTDSVMDSTLDLPMSVDAGVAATLAQRALYDAWNDRNRRSFKVSRKFACLSAGDVVTFEYPKGVLSDWRLSKLTDTGALIEGECVPANAAIYGQTAVGGSEYSGQAVAPLAAPTRLQLLDIPLLRDADNDAGIYAALDSYGDVPASAELLVGDDDNTLVPRGTVSASAPIGVAETALGAWSRKLIDETNLITVDLGDDVFNSVTRDVLLVNGGEFWALGAPGRWEIGCSALGASLGGGRYILSRHMRGLFGTERFAGTHQAGDTIVLLRIAGILRPPMPLGDVGSVKSYRAVTKGRSQDSALSQTYANTAEGLMPLSPVNARRAFVNRDIQIDRRSRLTMNNATGSVPLGEAGEAYQWRFYTSGAFTTLLATVATTTPTITEAQQTAAGITPSATAFVRVSQISDSVGTGHELQATV